MSSTIGQGTSTTQRIGDTIELDHMDLKYSWSYADAFNRCRLMVIWQPGFASAPTVSTFLQNGPSGSPDFLSFPPTALFRNGARVLYDEVVEVAQNWQSTQQRFLRIPIKQRITYNSGATTSLNGEIYFLSISDSSIGPNPIISMAARVYFRDVNY